MTHSELLRLAFLQDTSLTKILAMDVSDGSPVTFTVRKQVVDARFIDPEFLTLILAAPELYRILSHVSEVLRSIEQYASKAGDPVLEAYASKQADAVNVVLIAARLGVQAADRVMRQEESCNKA